jgi:hypothetical protein
VKYTVPPEILEPLGAVGAVNPGPDVGTPVGEDADEELLLLLLLEEPQAAISTIMPSKPAALRSPVNALGVCIPPPQWRLLGAGARERDRPFGRVPEGSQAS